MSYDTYSDMAYRPTQVLRGDPSMVKDWIEQAQKWHIYSQRKKKRRYDRYMEDQDLVDEQYGEYMGIDE